jgi:predicted ArsR family transcriptional regulator
MIYLTYLTTKPSFGTLVARMEDQMSQLQGNQRFFASTRGQIITMLRRSSRTVEELAQALNLTDNAIRAHLATLERDGFVRQLGVRRGSGKPSYVYDLTPEADQLFPKAYVQVLNQLLEALSAQMAPEELKKLMRMVGRRIATKWGSPGGDLRTRLELAVNVVNELGGLGELEQRNGTYYIQGYSCPLAAAVPGHPEVCHLIETLLTELIGVPVREQCERGETARCCFIIATQD